MRTVARILLPVAALAVAASAAVGQGLPGKKLIEYGWDVPYPDYIRQHIREMEQRPFDGLIFRLKDNNHAFDTRPWAEADLRPQFDDLAAIEWGKFTDNFLMLYAANQWGMDWFSDDQWAVIEANARLSSRAARAGRCAGVCFDAEPYGANPWAFAAREGGPSFAETYAKVRQRGAQFMRALQGGYPNMKLFTLFEFTFLGHGLTDPSFERRMEILQNDGYGLYAAFINGMLEAAAPDVVLIDGNEAAYYYTTVESYFRAYHLMRQQALGLVAPELWDRFHRHQRAGMAVYFDQLMDTRTPPEQFLGHYLSPEDRLKWMENNVYWALHTCDEYTWYYSEKMNWWTGEFPEGLDTALQSARDKIARGQPLGFSVDAMLKEAERQKTEAVQARIEHRSTAIGALPAGAARPVPDGDLSDAAWAGVTPLEPFVLNASRGDQREPAAATVARVAYDDEALYLAFECGEPKTEAIQIGGGGRDSDLWYGDTVELFFSRGPGPTPYTHFIVNPASMQWDAESVEGGTDSVGWSAEWQSGARIGDASWTAEFVIPWDALGGKPGAGETRKANVCRARIPERELSTWSTVVDGFVEPLCFGEWMF